MSRDLILSRIRAANAQRQTEAAPADFPIHELSSSDAAVCTRFLSACKVHGVTAIETDLTRLPDIVGEELRRSGAPSARIRFNDPIFDDLSWQAAGITVDRGAASPHDFAALTRALCAVAETGTLVVASSAANPVTLAFLPEVHVITVDRRAIASTFEDAIDRVRSAHGTLLPRALNLITGASRTGDIGGRLVQGAHGPRRLIVCIV